MRSEVKVAQICILDADGVIKTYLKNGSTVSAITGDVSIIGGPGIGISSENSDVVIAAEKSADTLNNTYTELFNNLTDPEHAGYFQPYIGKLNNSEVAPSGNIWLLGDQCAQLNIFDGNDPANGLKVLDLCEACPDCVDYQEILSFQREIRIWLDGNKDLNLFSNTTAAARWTASAAAEPAQPAVCVPDYDVTPLQRPADFAVAYTLFQQYKALVYMWNYLMYKQSIQTVITQHPGNLSWLVVRSGYQAFKCDTCATASCTITAEWYSGQDDAFTMDIVPTIYEVDPDPGVAWHSYTYTAITGGGTYHATYSLSQSKRYKITETVEVQMVSTNPDIADCTKYYKTIGNIWKITVTWVAPETGTQTNIYYFTGVAFPLCKE